MGVCRQPDAILPAIHLVPPRSTFTTLRPDCASQYASVVHHLILLLTIRDKV
jgi:hypothetical protein